MFGLFKNLPIVGQAYELKDKSLTCEIPVIVDKVVDGYVYYSIGKYKGLRTTITGFNRLYEKV